jgi:hypothetical protein
MKVSTILRIDSKSAHPWFTPMRLLILAAILHLTVTTTVFAIGRYSLRPGSFDTDGIATSFADDGTGYRLDAVTLADLLARGEVRSWFTSNYPLHVKLYSISFAVCGRLLGFNILSAEPINLLCYLGILVLVFMLGDETFGWRAGLLAAATVALWPSFLLHTTQPLKDPLSILGLLTLMLVMMRLLLRPYSWRQALLNGVLGAAIAAGLWKMRSDMAPVLLAIEILGAALLVLKQFLLRSPLPANLAAQLLLLALTAGAILFLPVYRDADNPRHHEREALRREASVANGMETEPRWWQAAAQVGIVRHRFVSMYPDSGSNLDTNVNFATTGDLIRYLPRATEIGFFAPFPNMWFETGNSVGTLGRKLSGLETVFMYGVEALAVVGLWRGRRRISVWLLFSIAATGVVALGLVVTNVGALYRLRYVFMMLVIVMGSGGVVYLFDLFVKRRAGMTDLKSERIVTEGNG